MFCVHCDHLASIPGQIGPLLPCWFYFLSMRIRKVCLSSCLPYPDLNCFGFILNPVWALLSHLNRHTTGCKKNGPFLVGFGAHCALLASLLLTLLRSFADKASLPCHKYNHIRSRYQSSGRSEYRFSTLRSAHATLSVTSSASSQKQARGCQRLARC